MVNEPDSGIVGRGFYCPFDVDGVDLLLISKNPGVSDSRENDLYAPLTGSNRVAAHEEFVHARFIGENDIITSSYHANIIDWVSVILNVPPEHDAVFARTAMTALVKCHSDGEKTKSLPRSTKDTCADAFLYAELEAIKPRLLLAMGAEPYDYLTCPEVVERHGLSVARLWHPSWTNMRGGVEQYKRERLPEIRRQFLDAVDRRDR